MNTSNMIFQGAVLIAAASILKKFFLTPSTDAKKIIQHVSPWLLQEIKVAEVAVAEASPPVQELAQHLIDSNINLYLSLRDLSEQRSIAMPQLSYSHEGQDISVPWEGENAFDIAYLLRVLVFHQDMIDFLDTLVNSSDKHVRSLARDTLHSFTDRLNALRQLIAEYIASDEGRIREFAHQIWLEEGRPEGQASRHWEMARRLSDSLSMAELQLKLEQTEWESNTKTIH